MRILKKDVLKHLKKIANVIKNGLPHAFDSRYWTIANTTYKEEIVSSIMEEYKLDVQQSKWFLRRCNMFKSTHPILYFKLDGHIEEMNGAHYGKTPIGKKFIDDYIMGRVKKSYK